MSQDWPSPQRPTRPPLPTTEDLPLAPEGYDRASVDDAFDAFYRHIAQLDASLRTLEAVESFRVQASELRADLRAIRAAGWSPFPRGYSPAAGLHFGLGIPEAVPRLALEVLFLVVVAVVAAVGSFSSLEIVGIMAVAVALTALVEWFASRDRRPALPLQLAASPVSPADVIEAVPATDGAGWAAFSDVTDTEAKSMLGRVASEPEPSETTEQFDEPEPEAEATAEEPPREVDPWERGFDFDADELDGDTDEAPLPA
jgi:hypothetical protein